MKRVFLSAMAIMAIITAHTQNTTDSTGFKSRKLKLEEINLVSSYYAQQGDHAAVTGGIGSQKLTDIANTIDIRLTHYDKKFRKHSWDAEVGIDHYSSASSDKIDLKANSSASHADTRIYPSLSWSMENEKKGQSIGAGVSASTEFDYRSFGGSFTFSKKTHNRNGELAIRLQALFDNVSQVLPVELRQPGNEENYPGTKRTTYAASLTWSQVVNERLQLSLLTDLVSQTGYLSLPFYRVYFTDGSVHQETLPDQRFKIPVGLRANYFLGDKFIIRAYYRYYTDNWGLHSHTASLELPVKLTPFLSVSPFYRYYTQTAIHYFRAYGLHTAADKYYSSNYDLSGFNSHFTGVNFRITPLNGVFGIRQLKMAEIRYGHYNRKDRLTANNVSLNLQFK